MPTTLRLRFLYFYVTVLVFRVTDTIASLENFEFDGNYVGNLDEKMKVSLTFFLTLSEPLIIEKIALVAMKDKFSYLFPDFLVSVIAKKKRKNDFKKIHSFLQEI